MPEQGGKQTASRGELASARSLAEALPCEGVFGSVADRPSFLFLPRPQASSSPMPWVWYAPTLAAHPDASHVWMFRQFLEKGLAIAGIDVGESYGNPAGRSVFTAFAETLRREFGLAEQGCLLPQSRGGLMLYNWAAENPGRVAGVAGIYPVCDLASWPGLSMACVAYGLTEQELALRLAEHNPIERLKPLAEAGVPILHVHGDIDLVVPLERNSGELARRYERLGGTVRLIVVPGGGHEVSPAFFRCQALVDFVIAQALSGRQKGTVPK